MDDRSIRLRWIGFLEDDAIKPTAGTNFSMDRLLASDALQAPPQAQTCQRRPEVAFHLSVTRPDLHSMFNRRLCDASAHPNVNRAHGRKAKSDIQSVPLAKKDEWHRIHALKTGGAIIARPGEKHTNPATAACFGERFKKVINGHIEFLSSVNENERTIFDDHAFVCWLDINRICLRFDSLCDLDYRHSAGSA